MNSDLILIIVIALLMGNYILKAVSKVSPFFEWVSGYRREARGALFLAIGMLAAHFLIYLPLEIFGFNEFVHGTVWYSGWRVMYWSVGIACFIGVPWVLFSTAEKLRPWWAETLSWIQLRVSLRGYATHLYRRAFLQKTNYSMEIDLLIVCTKGVFVLEVKAAQGIIHGDPANKQWIQTLGSTLSPVSHGYRNPLYQNAPKAKEIAGILRNKGVPLRVHNLVYFSHAKLVIEPESPQVLDSFEKVFNYIKALPVSLTLEQVNFIDSLMKERLAFGPKAMAHHMRLVQAARDKKREQFEQASSQPLPEKDAQ